MYIEAHVALGGAVVIVLAIGPKIRGFKLGRGQWIFKSDNNSYHDLLKSSVACR
jgi:hypothetical protein